MSGAEAPVNVLDAIARQIAEDLVDSCRIACRSEKRAFKDILTPEVIGRMVAKFANKEGRYVRFKSVPFHFRIFNTVMPNSKKKKEVDEVINKTDGIDGYMVDLCDDDDKCNIDTLQQVVKSVLLFYTNPQYYDATFELIRRGGTKRFVRRGRSHRRGHKQKTRRHRHRRSTRKH
jgi:hypothetical protein